MYMYIHVCHKELGVGVVHVQGREVYITLYMYIHVCHKELARCCTCTLYVQYVCHFRRISPSVSLSFSLSLPACDVLQILKLTGDFIDQSSIRWEF